MIMEDEQPPLTSDGEEEQSLTSDAASTFDDVPPEPNGELPLEKAPPNDEDQNKSSITTTQNDSSKQKRLPRKRSSTAAFSKYKIRLLPESRGGMRAAKVKQGYFTTCYTTHVRPSKHVLRAIERAFTENNNSLNMPGNDRFVSNERISDAEIPAICELLTQSPVGMFTKLDLGYNTIGDAGVDQLLRTLSKRHEISELNLTSNSIMELGTYSIALYLAEDKTLSKLSLRGNNIGRGGGLHISSVLRANATLTDINLGECDIHCDAFIDLMNTLRLYNRNMLSLGLSAMDRKSMNEKLVYEHMSLMLKANQSIQKLLLDRNGLGDTGFRNILPGLHSNSSLLKLDLRTNKFTRDTARHLAKWLQFSPPLQTLLLDSNDIRDEGCSYLASCLIDNVNLKNLSIIRNACTDNGIFKILMVLCECNVTLQCFYFWQQKNILGRSPALVQSMLTERRRLKLEQIDSIPYNVDGEWFLATQPKKNPSLWVW